MLNAISAVRTAFGDYKKRGKAAKPKGRASPLARPIEMPAFSSTPLKRKEPAEALEVEVVSQHCDAGGGNERKRQKVSHDGQPDPAQESPEKIYVSRYFNTKKASMLKSPGAAAETPEKSSPLKSPSMRTSAKKARSSGSWFSQLDAKQSTEGKLIYRIDNLTEDSSDSLTTLPDAKENGEGSRPKSGSGPCREALRTVSPPQGEKRFARNPFAKKTATAPTSSPKSPKDSSAKDSDCYQLVFPLRRRRCCS